MNTQTFLENWQRAGDHVLAVLLAEHTIHGDIRRWERASLERGLNVRHFPPGQWRALYMVLDSMRALGEPVHQSTLLTRLNGQVEQSWLVSRIALYSELLDGAVFERNVSDILQMGEIASVRRYLKDADIELETGKGLDSTVAELMSNLAFSSVEVVKNEAAVDAANELQQYLSQPPEKTISTGIGCLDAWMGGIGEDDVIGIAAPYKMRKSTLARNLAMNIAREGGSVAILMYESNKRMVAAQFVTMFAIEFLINNGLYNKIGDHSKNPLKWISAKDLVRVRAGYKQWERAKVAAIDYGIGEYRKLEKRLRIYDKSKEGGGLYDLGSAQRVLLRDKRLYGTDLAVIDHATQIIEGGSIYDRMSTIAPFLETFARRQKMALCILAQMNEATVKSNRDDHSPGVKGGGDLPAAVDYLFTVSYREEDENGSKRDDVMTVTMHLSRYGSGGTDVKQEIPIDPGLGVIAREVYAKGGAHIVNPLTTMDEPSLKALFFKTMIADFHIAPEVTGVHIIEKKNIRADFIIRPKPHLIKATFDDVYIAVEVKSPNGGSLFKASETMWQAASYGQSLYWGKVRPGFAIVFPDLEAFQAEGKITDINGTNPTAPRILSHIGQFMNVGFLSLDKYVVNGWTIRIGGLRYYSKQYGKSAMKLINRYVGNKAS